VETLSVYFSKRVPPPELPYSCFNESWVPCDKPGRLEEVVMRLFHHDHATFTKHISSLRVRKTTRPPSQQAPRHHLAVLTLPESGSHVVEHVFRWNHYGAQVFIRGTFTEWRDELMEYDSLTREHTSKRSMPPGIHLYCYRIKRNLVIDMEKPYIGHGSRRRNILVVSSLTSSPDKCHSSVSEL